jgi:hypothetical protein
MFILLAHHFPWQPNRGRFREAALLVISNARRIFNCQRSDFFISEDVENYLADRAGEITFGFFASQPKPTGKSAAG